MRLSVWFKRLLGWAEKEDEACEPERFRESSSSGLPTAAAESGIDFVVRQKVVAPIDEATAERDDRSVDEVQCRRACDLADVVVADYWMGPLRTTGADAQLVQRLNDANNRGTAVEQEVLLADEDLEIAERELPPEVPAPQAPLPGLLGALSVYAISSAASLSGIDPFAHVAETNATLSSFLAIGAGALMAVTAVGSTYRLDIHKVGVVPVFAGQQSPEWLGIGSGLAMTVGLGAARASVATTAADLWAVVALTLLDLSALGYAKFQGIQHRAETEKWRATQAGRPDKLKARDLARHRRDRAQERLSTALCERKECQEALDRRLEHDFDLDAKRAVARQLAVEAYRRRVDLNNARARNERRGRPGAELRPVAV